MSMVGSLEGKLTDTSQMLPFVLTDMGLCRFVSTHGPQISYPIPEGILNHHGKNEVLLSFWALGGCDSTSIGTTV
jgi:hypothetical protein